MIEYCYLNGKILPLKDAKVSVLDIGILRGYGVFDFARTYNGRPHALGEHIKRLKRSAARLGLTVPLTEMKLAAVINQLIKKNGFEESTIRMVLTGGLTINGINFDRTKPTFFILVQKFDGPSSEAYSRGVKLITVEHQRIVPEAKTNNYITAVRNQSRLRKEKGFEILYHHQGNILELSTSNIFIVKNNVISTPKDNILVGTTRNFTIKLAKKLFSVQERNVSLQEALKADEVFLTATNKGIVPVVAIDKAKIGKGTVGPVTRRLMNEYEEFIVAKTEKHL